MILIPLSYFGSFGLQWTPPRNSSSYLYIQFAQLGSPFNQGRLRIPSKVKLTFSHYLVVYQMSEQKTKPNWVPGFNSVCPVKIFKENCLAFFDLWTILNPVSYFDPIELLWPSPHNSFSWSLLPSIKGGFRFPSRWNRPLHNSCLPNV